MQGFSFQLPSLRVAWKLTLPSLSPCYNQFSKSFRDPGLQCPRTCLHSLHCLLVFGLSSSVLCYTYIEFMNFNPEFLCNYTRSQGNYVTSQYIILQESSEQYEYPLLGGDQDILSNAGQSLQSKRCAFMVFCAIN